MRYVTPSPRNCWKPVSICSPFRRFWGTSLWARRRVTRTCGAAICRRPASPWICCPWSNCARDPSPHHQELLPVEYFHVVLTAPHELAPVAAAHPVVFYNLLFRAVRETLLEVAATPRHLGARIGGLMVLHTWGQTLERHPHVHVIVPGGGLSDDGTRWISCKAGFFLPVPVLSRL